MLWMSCIAEYLVNGEVIPKQIAQVLRRGGAEIVKVESEECFGKQPLLRGQCHGSLPQACRLVSLFPYHR